MLEKNKIFVAGHKGMVGSSLLKKLKKIGYSNSDLILTTSKELDLTNQSLVNAFFKKNNIDQVYIAAAKVGGIYANNNFPAEFIYKNLMIQSNIIDACFRAGIKKILFLGSSCIYPKLTTQPMKEECLLTGKLEETNEPYAIAKIAGIKMCESYNRQYGLSHGLDYRCVMPTNLYGPGDNYEDKMSHVIPALIKRFHEAKVQQKRIVKVWGTGEVKREFLYVEDLADACVFLMNIEKDKYKKISNTMVSHINVGSGEDISIKDLSYVIAEILDYKGSIVFDTSMLDGVKQKLLDSTKINKMGWSAKVTLEKGIDLSYKDFLENCNDTKK